MPRENKLLLNVITYWNKKSLATKKAISRFTEMAGRLTRLDEEELKICEQIGKLNSKKFELEREIEEALKELDQYNVSLIEKSQNIWLVSIIIKWS